MLLALVCAASGCASLQSALDAPDDEARSAAAAAIPTIRKITPEAAYDAGALALVRGDDAAARREWDRCLAISSADSPSRVNCLVALERLANQTAMEP
jgi:hypothetical protein